MAKILVKEGVCGETEMELKDGINAVGRSESNDIRLNHASVSSHHCVIIRHHKGSLHIKDLGSTNGTFVDGVRITEAELDGSEELMLGQVSISLNSKIIPELPDIVIPQTQKLAPSELLPRYDDRGVPMCSLAREAHADYECRACGKFFSWDKVNHLGIAGKKQHHYCPACGQECVRLAPPPEPETAGKKIANAFGNFMKALYPQPDSKKK